MEKIIRRNRLKFKNIYILPDLNSTLPGNLLNCKTKFNNPLFGSECTLMDAILSGCIVSLGCH